MALVKLCPDLVRCIFSFLKDDGISMHVLRLVSRKWFFVVRALAFPNIIKKDIKSLLKSRNLLRYFLNKIKCRACVFYTAFTDHTTTEGLENLKAEFPDDSEWNSACSYATDVGNYDGLVWMRKNSCRCGQNVTSAAAYKGELEILKFLIQEDCEHSVDELFAYAATAGHKHIIRWLIMRFELPSTQNYICLCAANSSHFSLVKWLLVEVGFAVNLEHLYKIAVSKGNTKFTRWIDLVRGF